VVVVVENMKADEADMVLGIAHDNTRKQLQSRERRRRFWVISFPRHFCRYFHLTAALNEEKNIASPRRVA
jgi:hypothetical protein